MSTPAPDGGDSDIVAAIRQCIEAERNGTGRIPLIIGPFSAYAAVAGLQLAWRHPDMPAGFKQAIYELGKQLETIFADGPLAGYLAAGWDTSLDGPPDDQNPAS